MAPNLSVSIPSSPTPDSPPSLTMSSPSSPQRTNTLVITRLPPHFFDPIIQEALKSHFSAYGPIHTWAPIRGLARVIFVYYSEEDAEIAKMSNDGIVIGEVGPSPEFVMRVYRADPTKIESPDMQEHNHYLRPPKNEKNFLISPPGSPPVGWEQIVEDPPNAAPLANDLIAALRKLQLEEDEWSSSRAHGVLLEPEDGVGISVCVVDCDAEVDMDETDQQEEQWVYGETTPSRMRMRPTPTAMPPISIMG